MMAKYIIWGSFEVTIEDMEIEANTEEEAEEKAKAILKDRYHLSTYGMPHNPDRDVNYRLYTDEDEDEK